MSVKLINVTPDAEKQIAYCARVSNPNNQDNPEYSKLVAYCIKHEHWSVFEHGFMTLEINTTRGIAAQILRHRSFTFQEFCMSGDTQVYFDLPGAVAKGKRQKYTLSLEHLYNNWTKNAHTRSNIQKMHVRVFDEKTRTLTHAHIKEVFQTGLKDVFEITLENGKVIRSTKQHKVLTEKGFKSLEDCLGLRLINNTAVIDNNIFIGCNGIPVYQDYEWMKTHKQISIVNGTGLNGLSKEAGVTTHTIRKWLKKHGLGFTKKEVASYTTIWNKGLFGYSTGRRSAETRQADISKYRLDIMNDYDGCCGLCNEKISGTFHLHHIVPVYEDISLAREYSNLMPAHPQCHMEHHKLKGDNKVWRQKGQRNTLTVSWSKVKSVKYLGQQMTYDLEIDHDSHNYIADGVVVHNSQRYSDTTLLSEEIPLFELRRQDAKNRQNSTNDLDEEIVYRWNSKIREHFAKSKAIYDGMIKDGIAKECARFILPLATPTRLYVTGSVRSWIHYIQLRSSNGTQKEHMDIANECKSIFCKNFPIVSEALGWNEN
jgi:thymidylate synthase (FAD)